MSATHINGRPLLALDSVDVRRLSSEDEARVIRAHATQRAAKARQHPTDCACAGCLGIRRSADRAWVRAVAEVLIGEDQ